jgi:predicted nucleic-acid-binding protein
VIAIETNVLARFYGDDPSDPEAKRQRPIARTILLDSPAVFIPLTVVLEFEWVLRGFYEFEANDIAPALDHLLGMAHVTVERWEAVEDAVELYRQGLDFADSLHLCCSASCERFYSFDDRKFVRRARRLNLTPEVSLAR